MARRLSGIEAGKEFANFQVVLWCNFMSQKTLWCRASLSQLSQFSIRSSRFEPERRGERATKQCQEIESLKKRRGSSAQLRKRRSGSILPSWILAIYSRAVGCHIAAALRTKATKTHSPDCTACQLACFNFYPSATLEKKGSVFKIDKKPQSRTFFSQTTMARQRRTLNLGV